MQIAGHGPDQHVHRYATGTGDIGDKIWEWFAGGASNVIEKAWGGLHT